MSYSKAASWREAVYWDTLSEMDKIAVIERITARMREECQLKPMPATVDASPEIQGSTSGETK